MALNQQRGNMYDWITHTWNPLGGSCPHRCVYCSTKTLIVKYDMIRVKYSGPPYLVEKEMNTVLGEGKTIFVCNMTDLFAREVHGDIIRSILDHCRKYPKNTYFFQTKNPDRLLDFWQNYPSRIVLGTTIETNVKMPEISEAPITRHRADAMIKVKAKFPKAKISVTIEPIMDFWEYQFPAMIKEIMPDFVSIGADSKGHSLNEPEKERILNFIRQIEYAGIEVKKKDNLKRIIG